MAERSSPESAPTDIAEAAIARVLDAERASRDAIARARSDAAAIAENARIAARALQERTERRVSAIRVAFDRHTASTLAALDAEAAALATGHVLSAEEEARLERAVAALAVDLTGGAR